LALNHDNVSK